MSSQDQYINCGDVLKVLSGYPDNFFTGMLSDPPYELGFMGRTWDKSGIAFSTELWREIYRVLDDGSYLLAFGGSRTFHRLSVAIEDAGFEIRDHLMWMYGTGFPKGKAALKPAYEPIVLARKPHKKTYHLNIDACRIESGGVESGRVERSDHYEPNGKNSVYGGGLGGGGTRKPSVQGRWPANLLLDAEAAAILDAQSGERRTSKPGTVRRRTTATSTAMAGHIGVLDRFEPAYGDEGGASRFFYNSKASSKERNAGLDGFADKASYMVENGSRTAGTNGVRHARVTVHKNNHPCVKPIDVCRWLATLIRPVTDAHLLVPFSGSGSEMIGGLLAGWDTVTGIERDREYCRIAGARIAHWTSPNLVPYTG